MNYSETLDYLFRQLPMYQRIGKAAYKADLDSTLQLMQLLDHPELGFKSVHVAGTNGKGTVSHSLASIFQEAGYKTGLYTSPHLVDFRERIRLNGQKIPESQVVSFVEKYKSDFEKIGLSFFEWSVGLAFDYFRNEKVDIAIIEVGMGGRLDSTNVITPELSVITNIGYDHSQFLGDTLDKIAGEKAGIVKDHVPLLIGKTQSETETVFRNQAKNRKAPIHFADTGVPNNDISAENQQTIRKAIELLRSCGWEISSEALENGIKNTAINTQLRGRWQILQENPTVICDVCHNEEGIRGSLKKLANHSFERLHLVLGFVADKEVSKLIKLFPDGANYYLTQANIPRSLPFQQLSQLANDAGIPHSAHKTVGEAYQHAMKNASDKDLILVCGSNFIVADLLSFLEEK